MDPPRSGESQPPGEVSSARRTAFRVLLDVSRRRGEPASLLESYGGGSTSAADRDLATEIVYGVLRWQARLDHLLSPHSRRPLAALDPGVLLALRMGLYQLTHLSRVPEHAAVDESVKLARAFGAARASGYVNAVLRSALRRPGKATLPRAVDDPLGFLSVTLSHPRWLAARYLATLGLEGAEARCRVQNEPPPAFCRVTDRLSIEEAVVQLGEDGIGAEPVATVPRCLRITSGRLRDSALVERGQLFIQEAGAQLVPCLLEARPGETVVDLCAAPGGKALATCERVRPGGRVLALDRRPSRVRLMASLAARAGAGELFPIAADGRALPLASRFDKVLLDAPCTSLGTLRRNPDIKWRVRESDLGRMAALQGELLRSASRHLAPGGRLVYATCSSEPEENEEVVAGFLEDHPEFRPLPAAKALPPAARHLVDASGALRTRPERDGFDAYFAVVLARSAPR